jgi:hypothetical protein
MMKKQERASRNSSVVVRKVGPRLGNASRDQRSGRAMKGSAYLCEMGPC